MHSACRQVIARATLIVLAAVAALLAPSSAVAHPAHLVEPLVVEDFRYAPADVTIMQGRSVQWRWTNAVPHSVTSAPGSPEAFDSGLHKKGDRSFVRRFDVPGTYAYFSRTSSPRIEGILRVLPYPGADPVIKRLRVKVRRGRPVARFKLNKRQDVVVRVQQRKRGKWRNKQAVSARLKKGPQRIRLRKTGAGRYRVKITGYDRYRRQADALAKFRVRRR